MVNIVATITDPIALCAYVVAAVFGLLTLKWNPKSDRPRDRQLFYFAVTVSFVALFGGLFLAWRKSSATTPTPSPVVQSSSGSLSPNVNSSGSGTVIVQGGTESTAPKQVPEKKK